MTIRTALLLVAAYALVWIAIFLFATGALVQFVGICYLFGFAIFAGIASLLGASHAGAIMFTGGLLTATLALTAGTMIWGSRRKNAVLVVVTGMQFVTLLGVTLIGYASVKNVVEHWS